MGSGNAMNIFELMEQGGHEELVFWYDKATGLKAVVAIHDTTLGPALGGCRLWHYACEQEAVVDALRLAQGMTYKNAAMGLDFGGGKSVIWAHADAMGDREAWWRAFGRLVHSLGGRYIVAEDVGTSPQDMQWVARETSYVGGLRERSGDPSVATAWGVLEGIKAACAWVYGSSDLAGRQVAVQGLGHVGRRLVTLLREAGASVSATDLDETSARPFVEELGAQWVAASSVYDVLCDIFSPCALGGVLNADTVQRLRCRIVAGSANNQLATPDDGIALRKRGILYVPDFVVNGGGVVNVAEEWAAGGYHQDRAFERIRDIGPLLTKIFQQAQRERVGPEQAAMTWARSRIVQLGQVKKTYVPG